MLATLGSYSSDIRSLQVRQQVTEQVTSQVISKVITRGGQSGIERREEEEQRKRDHKPRTGRKIGTVSECGPGSHKGWVGLRASTGT